MKRALIAAFLGVLFLSCGGKKDEASPPADRPAKSTEQSKPRAAEETSSRDGFSELIGARIVPYLDEKASSTEKAVGVGEEFSIYVFGEYDKMYEMSAAEFKLDVPEGIEVLGEVKSDSTIMTMGKYDKDFMMAIKCTPGPKIMLMKYLCRVGSGFQGGVIETHKGETQKFIGFTLCDETRTLVAAETGRAVLKKK